MLKTKLKVMKKSINLLLLVVGLTSCSIKTDFEESELKCVVDSAEYHGIGQDNTLQTTPYWKIHLKETDMWVRTQNQTNVGDTVRILLRK